jgi:excisionase family DNA binding protein
MTPTEPMSSQSSRRLTSWKEIAKYLGVNVRTAQKWERTRELPIHRMAGVKSRVTANIGELDSWRQQLTRESAAESRSYSWPLGEGVTVELRFQGAAIRPADVDRLMDYLRIYRTAISSRDR